MFFGTQCSSVLYGYSQNLGKFGGPQLPYQKLQEISAAGRHLGTPLGLRLPHGKIVIILRCNP